MLATLAAKFDSLQIASINGQAQQCHKAKASILKNHEVL